MLKTCLLILSLLPLAMIASAREHPPLQDTHRLVERFNREDGSSVLSDASGTPKPAHSIAAPTIPQIEAYLNGLTTMVAEFEQHSTRGLSREESSTGRFYLSRPGKLRWEYDPPTPLIIVVSNRHVTMLDTELDQITFGNTEDHFTTLLTKPHIQLEKDANILHFSTHSGITRLTLQHPTKPETGMMTLLFHAKPLTLVGIEIEDQNHHITHVTFKDVTYGTLIDSGLFILKDPRIFGKRK